MARILVIDDENLVRLTLEAVLSARGHVVSLADDGRRGSINSRKANSI